MVILFQDDKLTILATLFWVGASLLESDYEHEFLLGVRLLARVMARLPLDRPDARERLDRTQAHGTHGPPSLHSLLLKVRIIKTCQSKAKGLRLFPISTISINR